MTQKSKQKTRWGCLAVPIFFTLLLGLASLVDFINKDRPSVARTSLPYTASEIQEHNESGLAYFHDYLKARMLKSEVEAYAQKVGAIKKVGEIKKESEQALKKFVSWYSHEDWFNPKEPPLYYYHERQYRVIVGWENGYVYFDTKKW